MLVALCVARALAANPVPAEPSPADPAPAAAAISPEASPSEGAPTGVPTAGAPTGGAATDAAPADGAPTEVGGDPYEATLAAWLATQGVPAEEAVDTAAAMMAIENQISRQSDRITLRDGAIALTLGPGDRYASPTDTSRILEAWGNPPDASSDGLLLPAGSHLFGPGSWAVLVRFAEDGWVDDSDAGSIDYDELLIEMQAGQEQGNAERRELGLQTVSLTGWAEPPRYDAPSHVLYWATLLRDESGAVTLNYDVRVLGRRGVLSLNALAGESDLAVVRAGMERIRGLASFEEGHRYADYVPGSDAKAAYGLAALVAGGAVAAKTGLFKGLLALLLASKKLLIVGVLAIGGVASAFFRRLRGGGED